MPGFGDHRVYGALTKVEEQEDGTIKVYGVASTGARDEAGEIVTPEAMKAALPDYMKFGAIREMHQPQAAGTALEANVDGEGVTRIATHVVDPLAVKKVQTGVYKGFSIGGRVTGRDPKDPTIITGIRLVEVSLVDRPCNPEAVIDVWKAESSATEEQDMTDNSQAADQTATDDVNKAPTNDEVKAEAEIMAKAAGKDGKWKDFVAKAREALIAKAAEPAEETAAEVTDGDAGEPEAQASTDDAPDPADALSAALELAAKAGQVDEPVATPPQITPGLADTGRALGKLIAQLDGDPMAKGLWTVGSLARLIDDLACIQNCTAWEAAAEGDDSPVPQELAAAIQALGATLVSMAQEEVAELVQSLRDGGADLDIMIVDDDADMLLAAKLVDLVKADADLMEKAGKRNSKADQEKVQGIHDHAQKLGAACDITNCAKADDVADLEKLQAENDRLKTAASQAVPQIEALAKRMDDQASEIVALKAELRKVADTPLPPLTAANGHVAVDKGADAAGMTEPASQDDIAKALAEMTEAQRGDLLMRVALRSPSPQLTARVQGRPAA